MRRDQDVFDAAGETLLRSFGSVKSGGVVVTVGGRPDARLARAWCLSLPLVWILGFFNRKVDRLARKKRARFEYLFMRASGEQLEKIDALADPRAVEKVVIRKADWPMANRYCAPRICQFRCRSS